MIEMLVAEVTIWIPASKSAVQQAELQKKVEAFLRAHPRNVESYSLFPFSEGPEYVRKFGWMPQDSPEEIFQLRRYGLRVRVLGSVFDGLGQLRSEWLQFLAGIAKEQEADVKVQIPGKIVYVEKGDLKNEEARSVLPILT